MFIPNKKQYNELTSAEKILVGYIYDLYFKWLTERNSPAFLKNSMFSDFARMMNFDDELKYYADYLYLCDYQDEKRERVNEYKSVIPKSPLTVATDTLTEKLESFTLKIFQRLKASSKKCFLNKSDKL